MPTYIMLAKLTPEGRKEIKKAPERFAKAKESIEAVGGKMTLYVVQGQYDYVAIADFPDYEVGWKILASVGTLGSVETQTMQAIPFEKFAEILKGLP